MALSLGPEESPLPTVFVGYAQASFAASQEEAWVGDFRQAVVKFRTAAPENAETPNVYRASRLG